MIYTWVFIIIVLAFIEVITVNLTTVWFVVSAIVSLLLSFLGVDFYIQFAVFTLLGIFLLITTRSSLQKLLNNHKENTNLDRVIGMTGIVTEAIEKNKIGEVKVDGKKWSAVSNENLKVDATVKILKIDGVKLIVEEEK